MATGLQEREKHLCANYLAKLTIKHNFNLIYAVATYWSVDPFFLFILSDQYSRQGTLLG